MKGGEIDKRRKKKAFERIVIRYLRSPFHLFRSVTFFTLFTFFYPFHPRPHSFGKLLINKYIPAKIKNKEQPTVNHGVFIANFSSSQRPRNTPAAMVTSICTPAPAYCVNLFGELFCSIIQKYAFGMETDTIFT
jgi:hypothetical protein